MNFIGSTGEYFEVLDVDQSNIKFLNSSKSTELSILWFQTDNNLLEIDLLDYEFNRNSVICTTEFNRINVKRIGRVKVIRWNRPFYCVLIHDSEVSCRGILFYGATTVPAIQLKPQDVNVLSAVWQVLENEMKAADKFQQEMLQMLLKRILILCTRLYKEQGNYKQLGDHVKAIRDYNFLVEQNFREKHSVSDYAQMMNKSPKTLSNLFKKLGGKTPLQFIHERKMLEARRLLIYTDKQVSEIGYELGFGDVQSFSRFFKNLEGMSPIDYKESKYKGKIAKS